MLYSWTARLNYIIYNVMLSLMLLGTVSHLGERYGHHVGLRQERIQLTPEQINFDLVEVD